MLAFATKLAPTRKKMQRALDAGFQHSEIWLSSELLLDVDPVIACVRESGLRVALHFPNGGELEETQLANAVRLYRAVESWAMVIHKPMLRSYGRRLALRAPEMVLALENGRQKGDQFDKWAEYHTDLTLDVEHLWKYTLGNCSFPEFMEGLKRFWQRHGSRVRHIHLPGYIPGSPEHSPAYCNPELVNTVWSFLLEQDYQGMVVSELNLDFQTPQHLRRDVIAFQRWKRSALSGHRPGTRFESSEDGVVLCGST